MLHYNDIHAEHILSETDAAKCSEVESSSPLSVYLHKIEESLSQPKNAIKENWKIVKPHPKGRIYSIEDCVWNLYALQHIVLNLKKNFTTCLQQNKFVFSFN